MSATAPNPLIYAFEDALESAVACDLEKSGVWAATLQQRDDARLKTTRVEVKFIFGGFSEQHYWVNQITKEKWLNTATGNLLVKICTPRLADRTVHARLRGSIRWRLQQVKTISDLMTLHSLVMMKEVSTTPDFQQDANVEVSSISCQVVMAIKSASFPQD